MASGDGYNGENTTGFASPARDSLEGTVDLSAVLDLRSPSRYPVRVRGDALNQRGIRHGDILIADAAAPPVSGRVVVAMIHGDVVVCELVYKGQQWWLQPSRNDPAVCVSDDIEIWATVSGLVRTNV
jgi:DNA polymerase V